MLNRAVFAKDPTGFSIPNDGVARVGMPATPQEWETLRWELQSFVCEGEYRDGLERILASYLSRIGQSRQPAVWVSGFYGSGKSHLVRVLDALWRDIALPDGVSARGLTRLPNDIGAQLTELTTVGRREGGLWSAAGTLSTGVGSSVRLAVMALVFRAAGLPEKFSQARFVLWLEAEGHRAAVDGTLQSAGRTLTGELTNMYVSRPLAEALLAAVPGIATSAAEVHQLLREQYKDVTEIGSDELVATLGVVIRQQTQTPERLPLVLVVLDELQQFLAEDPNRTLEVQDIVERCSAELGGRLLFVGTGQMHLGSTQALQKLRDRFTVQVALSDSDVDRVVRAVVLRKDPTKVGDVQQILERASGEINRQLGGTKIGARGDDAVDLVPDYPLLPARRRFWEAILRSVDSVGKAGQLRAQLRIVLEATQSVAGAPLGTVIPADAIYDPIIADLQQSGVLPRDTATLIAGLDASGPDGALRTRIAKLAFLIAKLEESGPLATGIRATTDTFADLLVDDLTACWTAMRQLVPGAVEALVADGTLLDVDGQFILQTPVAAEWLEAFGHEMTRLKNDDVWVADHRSQAMRAAVTEPEQIGRLSIPQGKSKVPRRLLPVFNDALPLSTSGEIPIWIRDGWSAPFCEVLREAQAAGTDSPVVFVFIPRQDHDAIRDALAAQGASTAVVNGRPMPQTDEGTQARSGIASRGQNAQRRLDTLIGGLLSQARIFQGGGNEVTLGTLKASVEFAATGSLARLFPRFGDADDPAWASVIERAKQGNPHPLGSIGYTGDPEKQPACAEVLRFLSAGPRPGKDVKVNFLTGPYGWPQDAVDGVLYALLAAGLVRARLNGAPVTAQSVVRITIGSIVFQVENVVLAASVKIAVKGLAAKLGLPVGSLAEAEIPSRLLDRLLALAEAAGGEAPLPAAPSREVIRDLQGLTGNEQVQRIFDRKAELQTLAETWKALEAKKAGRTQGWKDLQALLRHADDRSTKADVAAQAGAILASRTLLDDPDPVGPLVHRLADELRARYVAARDGYEQQRAGSLKALESDELWQRLEGSQREPILRAACLGGQVASGVATTASLVAALDQTAPSDWEDRIDALPSRVLKAREQAAKLLEPTTVPVRPASATIRTEDELDAYLRRLRDEIIAHLRVGNPVVL